MDDRVVQQAFAESPAFAHLGRLADVGDLDALDTEAKRHHFVSQFMLERFREDRERPHLFQLDVRTGKPQRVTIEGAASRRASTPSRTRREAPQPGRGIPGHRRVSRRPGH